jgi:hypothetical protein
MLRRPPSLGLRHVAAMSRFSEDRMVAEHLDLYTELLSVAQYGPKRQ